MSICVRFEQSDIVNSSLRIRFASFNLTPCIAKDYFASITKQGQKVDNSIDS